MSQQVEQMLSTLFSGNQAEAVDQFNKIISQRALTAIDGMKQDVGSVMFNQQKEQQANI